LAAATAPDPGLQVARLEREVEALRGRAALVDGSPGERLAAVEQLAAGPADPRAQEALLRALETDRSVNVQLAALDGLRRVADLGAAQGRLVALLDRPESPVLRTALIELLVERRVVGAREVLHTLTGNTTDPALQSRARWALRQLS
ncbi:MAG TPA: hypothetical protein VHQ65_08665, partial [Thermoanaerobaculia bacterium]|nr:hypothetical protein [Thermoanaerobaculia bacterium]